MRLLAALASALIAQPLVAQGSGVPQSLVGAPFKGLHHAAITVSDIDSTAAFYSKAVPYPIIRRFKVKGSAFPAALLSKRYREVEIALVATPTGFIQLMDFEPGKAALPNPRPVIGPGYTHICFQSASSDPAIVRFKAAGLSIISRFGKRDGVDIGGYGVRYAYGRDPDGVMIENESLDQPRRKERAWITHIANTVHDRDAMLAFYEKLFRRAAHRRTEQENHPRLDDVADIDNLSIKGGWINLGNMDIEVWEYVRPQTPAPGGKRKLDEIGYNAFSLEVDDLRMEIKRLKSLGISLVGRPMRVGAWRVQYAYDPEGNLFSVQERRDAPFRESVASLSSL